MASRRGVVLGLALVVMWSGAGATEAGPGEPVAVVQSLLDAVRVLAEAADAGAETETIRRISGFFDLVGLSRACLQKTWETLSAEEQKRFVRLFQDVLEKVAYPKSAKFFKDTTVDVEEVVRENGRAEVTTLVLHPEEGEVEVGYCLHRVHGTWLIEDILLDGVSLRRDIRSQAQKILREESYEELKRRLQEKLAE